ncbi:MAG: hypothetical protein M3Y37_11835, partial [Chloroflexota bacterium]|nr:hypothetical protein [Chloroflexota bacterium]
LDTSISFVILLSLAVAMLAAVIFQIAFDDLSRVFTRPGYLIAFLIMSVTGTLGVLFDQISTVTRRGDHVLVRGAISGVVTLAGVGLLALAVGRTSPGPILIAWAVGNAVPVVIAVAQVRRSVRGYRYSASVERNLLGSMTRVGWPNWLLTLAERMPGTVLPIVALELLSAEANASWYTAWMMAWVVYVVPIQIGINLFAESSRGEHGLASIVRSGVVSSLALGIPTAVFAGVLAPYILRILGPEYADNATTPLRILLIAVIPFTVLQAYFAICRSRMRFREGIATSVAASGGGILAAAMVAGDYGLTGMAWAWLVTQTIASGWALWRLRTVLVQESEPEAEAMVTAAF